MRETVYLIDGSAYIYRAYHAIAPLSNSKGLPTNGVLGFINMIKKLRNDKNPSHQAIAFDSRGKVFRPNCMLSTRLTDHRCLTT